MNAPTAVVLSIAIIVLGLVIMVGIAYKNQNKK